VADGYVANQVSKTWDERVTNRCNNSFRFLAVASRAPASGISPQQEPQTSTLTRRQCCLRIGKKAALIELSMRTKLISVNVGLPREVIWHGMNVTTGIFKQPVNGRVALRKLNLDGDRQADLTVHGGKDKAVYCYPVTHYEYWKKELPGRDLPLGMFGENFTIDFRREDTGGGELGENFGLPEDLIHIGERFSVGSAEVVVTQPRLPCYKLGVRFQLDDMVKRFLISGRSGFYLAVVREGEVGVGDEMRAIGQLRDEHSNSISVSDVTRLYIAKRYSDDDARSVRRALQVAALPESWKEYFRERLERMNVQV
jgi:MOSC domain-containing protein YiiM